MITSADINLKTTFREQTKDGICEDLADYASLRSGGITNLYGLVSAVYANEGTLLFDDYLSPFIDIQGSETESAAFDLPLNTGTGNILFGDYSFVYTVFKRYSIENITMVSPGGTTIELLSDFTDRIEAGDTMTVTGSNNSGDGTYTVESVEESGGTTTVTLTTTMPADNTWDAVFTWSVSRTYDYCLTTLGPVPSIQGSYSCDAAKFVSEDTTDYGDAVLSSRTHRIQFPRNSSGVEVLADVVNSTLASNTTIYSTALWTGVHTISIHTTGTLQQTDGLYIEFDITALDNVEVECVSEVLEARSCIAKLYREYKLAWNRGVNPNPYQEVLTSIMAAYLVYRMYRNVGDVNTASTWAEEVLRIVNEYGCNCTTNSVTDEPIEVVPVSAIDTIFLGWQTPLTTVGDLYYRNVSNQDARLPIGTEDRVLKVYNTGSGLVGNWVKENSMVISLNIGPNPGGAMSGSIPKNYLTADGEGLMLTQVLRVSSGTTIQARLNTETPLGHSFVGAETYNIVVLLVKNGTDLDLSMLIWSPSTSPVLITQNYTANFAAVNTISISQTTPASVTGYLEKVEYVNNKVLI